MRKLCGRARGAAAVLKITITPNTRVRRRRRLLCLASRAVRSGAGGVLGGVTGGGAHASHGRAGEPEPRARAYTHLYVRLRVYADPSSPGTAASDGGNDESCENDSSSPRARETAGAVALFLEAKAKNKRARTPEFFDFSRLVPTPTAVADAAVEHFTGGGGGGGTRNCVFQKQCDTDPCNGSERTEDWYLLGVLSVNNFLTRNPHYNLQGSRFPTVPNFFFIIIISLIVLF